MSMCSNRPGLAALLSCVLLTTLPAGAQDQVSETIPFAGGELTISETPDFEKVLAFDGRELARDYVMFFDGIKTVSGVEVAFFSAGPGGNACGVSAVMVWETDDAGVTADRTDDDCGAPPPALTDDVVYFVPYLRPGEVADVTSWSPEEGFALTGKISYAPQPGTSWEGFDAGGISYPLDVFRNAAVYDAAVELLGDTLFDVAMGLGTSGEPEISEDGVLFGRGCVPHACGLSDTFIAIDPVGEAVYLAQMQDGGTTGFWPERDTWPDAVSALIPSDF